MVRKERYLYFVGWTQGQTHDSLSGYLKRRSQIVGEVDTSQDAFCSNSSDVHLDNTQKILQELHRL